MVPGTGQLIGTAAVEVFGVEQVALRPVGSTILQAELCAVGLVSFTGRVLLCCANRLAKSLAAGLLGLDRLCLDSGV